MSLIDTVIAHDRILRKLCEELGVEFDSYGQVAPKPAPDVAPENTPKPNKPGYVYRPARSYKSWTEEEDACLLDLLCQGLSHAVIAHRMGRSVKSIGVRRWRLTNDGNGGKK